MIELAIPGRSGGGASSEDRPSPFDDERGTLRLEHLVTDVNGTLALDGILMDGVAKRIASLHDRLTVHLLTADTHGKQAVIDQQLNLTAHRLTPGHEPAQKQAYVNSLGPASVVAIGQGANDALMLQAAALGICVMSPEGAASETLIASDIVVPNIRAAFDLLDRPMRIVATLRK